MCLCGEVFQQSMTDDNHPMPGWVERKAYWRRRLKRLMFDAEPLEEQLERYRLATWGLTVVPAVIGSILFALFTAFGAPLTGAIVAGAIVLPIVAVAWLDFVRLKRGVEGYLRESAEARERDEDFTTKAQRAQRLHKD